MNNNTTIWAHKAVLYLIWPSNVRLIKGERSQAPSPYKSVEFWDDVLNGIYIFTKLQAFTQVNKNTLNYGKLMLCNFRLTADPFIDFGVSNGVWAPNWAIKNSLIESKLINKDFYAIFCCHKFLWPKANYKRNSLWTFPFFGRRVETFFYYNTSNKLILACQIFS